MILDVEKVFTGDELKELKGSDGFEIKEMAEVDNAVLQKEKKNTNKLANKTN